MNPKMLFIDPANELRFCGPFNRPVLTVMRLSNTTDQLMIFKIKTTAPKRYCVRPNIGKILPYKSAAVEICLQPFVYDPNDKIKHKFMVQSVVVPENCDTTDLNKLWKELEPDQLMDFKLKCVFEMPAATAKEDTSGSGNTEVVKEEPKVLSEEKISNLQSSDQTESLLAELRHLREDNTTLRKDNLSLKEQVVRLRCLPAKPPMNEPYTPVMAEKQIPMFYIAISIAAAVLGLLLGKYLL